VTLNEIIERRLAELRERGHFIDVEEPFCLDGSGALCAECKKEEALLLVAQDFCSEIRAHGEDYFKLRDKLAAAFGASKVEIDANVQAQYDPGSYVGRDGEDE